MAKRMTSALGVHKTKLVKRKKKRNKYGVMLRNVIDYLKSDCYMYAPLFSSQSTDLPPPKSISSSLSSNLTGIDAEEAMKEENNKKLSTKVVEYLKSDDYMYAPLLLHQPSLSLDKIKTSPQLGAQVVAGPKTPVSDKENRKMNQIANIPEESNGNPVARTVVKHTVPRSGETHSSSALSLFSANRVGAKNKGIKKCGCGLTMIF